MSQAPDAAVPPDLLVERYRTIIEAMDEGYCLIEVLYDATGKPHNYRFIEANTAFERQSGLANVVGKTILDFVPEFETAWFEAYHQVALTGVALDFESEFKSMGLWFDVRATRADAQGHVAILFKDITARKLSEAELRLTMTELAENEARFRSMFDSIDEGFCVVDMRYDSAGQPNDYGFLQVNPAFARQTGLDDVAGRNVRDIVPGIEDSWIALIGRAVETGNSVRFVSEMAALNRTFSVYVCRIGGPDSTRAAIVFTDITESTSAENELRRMAAELSESDRRKNEFLATLAHELRNPLAPLSNGLLILQRLGHDPAVLGKTVDMMKRQVVQMVHLVNDLLDVARISTGKVELRKERIELQSLIQLAIETSRHLVTDKRHSLEINLPLAPIMIDGDPTRIAQMVGNLLNNAAKYTPPGGQLEVSAVPGESEVTIVVKDNGIGVAHSQQARVFEMFTQVDHTSDLGQGGLGIGLSLVRKLAELHGGRVGMDSAGTGTGCTFSIHLPLPKDEGGRADTTSQLQSGKEVRGKSLRILIVDDNEDAATSLGMLLEIDGHDVSLAFDGRDGLNKAIASQPEFVFLDIGLPGLNGYEVVRAMRKNAGLAGIPIVALTGWGTDHDKAHATDAGFSSHITKPAEIGAVRALIKTLSAAAALKRTF